MKVALSVIATGKYTRFLCGLLGTAYEFFCPGHDVRILVFSDSAVPKHHQNTILIPTPHEPWPGPTLHRYRTMLRADDTLEGCDYVYYLDVNSRFVRPVGEEVFGDLAATVHYGFCEAPRRQWTYETRYASRAHVAPAERGRHYYCGGFQGGRAGIYLAAMRSMAAATDADERRGITACWHDESHWNRYLIDHPPDVRVESRLHVSRALAARDAKDRDRGQKQRGNETALATEEFGHGLNIDPEYRTPRNTDLNSKN